MKLLLYFVCFICLGSFIRAEDPTSDGTTSDSTDSSTSTNDGSTSNSPPTTTASSTSASTSSLSSSATTEVTTSDSTDSSTSTNDDSSPSTSTSSSTTTTPVPTTTPTTTTTNIPTTPVHITDVMSYTWSSDDLDESKAFIFEVPEGYFISAKVSNVEMSYGNYLSIQGGNVCNDQATDGRIFANTVKNSVTYLFKKNIVYAYCENTKTKGGAAQVAVFQIDFKQTGTVTTTESTTPTTTITMPTTEIGDSIYISVNVTGRSWEEYSNKSTLDAFRKCVSTMAINYCKEQNINLIHNITVNNVMIQDINHCPLNWPDSYRCVRITFSLPIFHDEAKWPGYQINTQHLSVMWLRWDELDDRCMRDNSFNPYREPDVERSIAWWAVGISLALVFFVALLWFLKTFSARLRAALQKRRANRARESDVTSILSRRSNMSVTSLPPHYLQDHQDTPKLFEN